MPVVRCVGWWMGQERLFQVNSCEGRREREGDRSFWQAILSSGGGELQ